MGDIKIYLDKCNGKYLKQIQNGLEYINFSSKIKYGDTVFIKPNLTFPYYKKGVMTNPECIGQLILAIKDYTSKIIVGESDGGGYNRFFVDNVFEKIGFNDRAKNLNIRLVNLSKLPSRNIYFNYGNKKFAIPLPRLLLDEVHLFITVPVPKVHIHTEVSLSIKNQWGCIQEPSLRLKLHPYFKKVIFEINKALRVGVSVIDGRYGLNRNGPLRGDPIELGWIMISNNILAADLICCSLLGINPLSIRYLSYFKSNAAITTVDDFHFNINYRNFIGPRFYVRRGFWDYISFLPFRSRFFAYLAYHSKLANILHNLMYLFREKYYDY